MTRSGGAIEETLQPFGEADEQGIFQHANRDGELRPEVAHLEEEFRPLEAGQRPGCDSLKDGRRGPPDQVHILHAQTDPEGGEHEGDEGQHSV